MKLFLITSTKKVMVSVRVSRIIQKLRFKLNLLQDYSTPREEPLHFEADPNGFMNIFFHVNIVRRGILALAEV